MRLFEEIRQRVEEMRFEDKKLFEKQKESDLEKLFKMVKEELIDFSFLIKESEGKIETLFKRSKSVKNSNPNQFSFGTPTNMANMVKLNLMNKSKEDYDHKDTVKELKKKNDELLNEMMELKEKFMDSRIKNIDLKNKLRTTFTGNSKDPLKSSVEKLFSKTEFKRRTNKFADPEENEKREENNATKQSNTISSDTIIKNYLEKVILHLPKIKEKNNEVCEKEEQIRHLTEKLKSAENQVAKLESREKKLRLEKLAEENKSKLNLDKLIFHKIYQYDTDLWGLISNKHKDKTVYQWIQLNDLKLNFNTGSLQK